MKKHQIELVSALLDNQLTGLRRWFVQRHVSHCLLCATEYRHQRHVREMLADNPPTAQMSDSAEFFWSQVKRGIEAGNQQTVRVPAPRLSVADWIRQHQYAVASAAAAVILAAGAFWLTQPRRTAKFVMIEGDITTFPNADAKAYSTSDKGTTVIWVSGLPWAPEISGVKSALEGEGM